MLASTPAASIQCVLIGKPVRLTFAESLQVPVTRWAQTITKAAITALPIHAVHLDV
jgi:hypothetical protein